eukprot:Seg1685.7 transcript_id=Seg1685.7/GoldUCD/mRNA.D3Y31 product="Kielin/chordin-like protein" protein_id=Seg1685.7/GoldUCD/D3Y31
MKTDFTRFKDITKTGDLVSFGKSTNDILVDRDIVKTFVKQSNSQDELTFTAVANLKQFDRMGRSTLISVLSPLTNRKYFEVFIQKSQGFDNQMLEGTIIKSSQTETDYKIAIVYSMAGREQLHTTSISKKFKEGKSFTLMVRIIGNSEIEVHFDCEKIEKKKLNGKMSAIPLYVEARLAHTVELDFWTSMKQITSRFVGDIKEAKFLFGKQAFEHLNPCVKLTSPGIVIEGMTPSKNTDFDNLGLRKVTFESLFFGSKGNCFVGLKKYEHGKTWNNAACQTCKCKDGVYSCHQMKCPEIKQCRNILPKMSGMCCPICLDIPLP